MKEGEGEESKVEESGIESREVDMGEVDDSEVEGSDQFEDCELKWKVSPIFHIIVTILNY